MKPINESDKINIVFFDLTLWFYEWRNRRAASIRALGTSDKTYNI